VFTAASVNVGMNLLKHTPERDLMLANVEALAQDEQNSFCDAEGERPLHVVEYDRDIPTYFCSFVCAAAVTGEDPYDIAADYYDDVDTLSGGVRPGDIHDFVYEYFPNASNFSSTGCGYLSELDADHGFVYATGGHTWLIYGVDASSPNFITINKLDTAHPDDWYYEDVLNFDQITTIANNFSTLFY